MQLLWLFLIPIIIAIVGRMVFNKTITWKEMGVQILICCLPIGIAYGLGSYAQTYDREILNGEVLSKERNEVSCSHSYSCNCVTSCSGSGNNRSCTEICQTCYDHSYDVDWDVLTNVGTLSIDRLDRQGLDEPPRWTSIRPGEPVAVEHGYTNYVQAVPSSLFNDKDVTTGDQFANLIPTYPRVYDYYHVNRIHAMGVSVPHQAELNQKLAEILKHLGPKKQANIHVVFVNTSDATYRYALERAWLGGKKNDIVIMLGTPHYPEILWADVMTWALNSGNEVFHASLRNALTDMKTVDQDKLISTIDYWVPNKFDRFAHSNLEYLKDEINPPTWVYIFCIILGIFGGVGAMIYMHKNDVFNEEWRRRY